MTVRYEAVNAMLLNEFLKEHRQVEEQKAGLAKMQFVVSKQEELIAKQQKQIAAQQANAAQQQKQIEAVTATVRKVSERVELSDRLSPSRNDEYLALYGSAFSDSRTRRSDDAQ